jgi:hypothetical protein
MLSTTHIIIFSVGVTLFMLTAGGTIIWKRKRIGSVSPVGEKILRPAGYSLRNRVADLNENFVLYPLFGFLIPILLALLPLVLFTDEIRSSPSIFYSSIGAGLIVLLAGWIVGCILTYRHIDRSFNCSLGLRGEELVAQQLNPLFREDYRIYHDFPLNELSKGANIDHIVIGPTGVFVIETKMRRKHKKLKTNQESHKVTFDGEQLIYPTFTDRHGIDQTAANAKYLADFLRKRTGAIIPVQGILVLPGWYVNQTKSAKVQVCSHKTVVKRILQSRQSLDKELIRKAVIAVRDVCCDVEI